MSNHTQNTSKQAPRDQGKPAVPPPGQNPDFPTEEPSDPPPTVQQTTGDGG